MKTGHERAVDLGAGLAGELQGWEAESRASALRRGQERTPWVFPSRAGTPVWQYYVRQDFAAIVKAAKLPPWLTPHCLRHTYASLMLQAGEPVQYVQRQLGHATITMTTDLYGRWLPAGDTAAADRLEARIRAGR